MINIFPELWIPCNDSGLSGSPTVTFGWFLANNQVIFWTNIEYINRYVSAVYYSKLFLLWQTPLWIHIQVQVLRSLVGL